MRPCVPFTVTVHSRYGIQHLPWYDVACDPRSFIEPFKLCGEGWRPPPNLVATPSAGTLLLPMPDTAPQMHEVEPCNDGRFVFQGEGPRCLAAHTGVSFMSTLRLKAQMLCGVCRKTSVTGAKAVLRLNLPDIMPSWDFRETRSALRSRFHEAAAERPLKLVDRIMKDAQRQLIVALHCPVSASSEHMRDGYIQERRLAASWWHFALNQIVNVAHDFCIHVHVSRYPYPAAPDLL